MEPTTLHTILKQHGYSLTKPRQVVFEHLQRSKLLTMSEIVEACTPKINASSVYRTVELFETIGITNRVWSGFKSKLELSEEFRSHHHHLTCADCGQITDFENENLENEINKVAQNIGGQMLEHHIEITIRCSRCL